MDPESIDLVAKLIGSLGFPIFVAVWLLLRTDKIMRDLATVIEGLRLSIEKLLDERRS